MTIKLGLLGYGKWGANLARVAQTAKGGELIAIADMQPERRKEAAKWHPNTKIVESLSDLLATEPDAVIIATPPTAHHQQLIQTLAADKHVLVEKPVTTEFMTTADVVILAKKKQLVLMADHIPLFDKNIRKLKVWAKYHGDIVGIKTVRTCSAPDMPSKIGCGALYDLAPHDIATVRYILNESEVSDVTNCYLIPTEGKETYALYGMLLRWIRYDGLVSFSSAFKQRTIELFGADWHISYDALTGNLVSSPEVEHVNLPEADEALGPEPLQNVLNEFVAAVETKNLAPLTGPDHIMGVMRALAMVITTAKARLRKLARGRMGL